MVDLDSPLVALVAWVKVGRKGPFAQAQSLAYAINASKVPPHLEQAHKLFLELSWPRRVDAIGDCLVAIRKERRRAVQRARGSYTAINPRYATTTIGGSAVPAEQQYCGLETAGAERSMPTPGVETRVGIERQLRDAH